MDGACTSRQRRPVISFNSVYHPTHSHAPVLVCSFAFPVLVISCCCCSPAYIIVCPPVPPFHVPLLTTAAAPEETTEQHLRWRFSSIYCDTKQTTYSSLFASLLALPFPCLPPVLLLWSGGGDRVILLKPLLVLLSSTSSPLLDSALCTATASSPSSLHSLYISSREFSISLSFCPFWFYSFMFPVPLATST